MNQARNKHPRTEKRKIIENCTYFFIPVLASFLWSWKNEFSNRITFLHYILAQSIHHLDFVEPKQSFFKCITF